MKLSVLMPAYNESATVEEAVARLLRETYPCDIELIIVDDGSTDDTWARLNSIVDPRVDIHRHHVNRGKGAAVRTAASQASGDYVVIFDADLEYRASDIPRLLEPIERGDAQVVFGARSFGSSTAHSFWFVIGNKITTFVANAWFNSWIHDLHTCLKVLPLDLLRELDCQQNRFAMDTELTAKLLARGIRPYEIPVDYKARSHEEGKKISWRDGVVSLWILTRVRLTKRPRAARPVRARALRG